MKVMLLTADYPPGLWSGIGAAVEVQAEALAAVGAEVHIILPRRVVWNARESGPYLHSLDGSQFPVNPRRFDWLHLHSLSLAELALEMGMRFGIPLAYTAHSLIARELAEGPESRRDQPACLPSGRVRMLAGRRDARTASGVALPGGPFRMT